MKIRAGCQQRTSVLEDLRYLWLTFPERLFHPAGVEHKDPEGVLGTPATKGQGTVCTP